MPDTLEPELRPRVAGAPVAHLATVRPDGDPHVVVITFALLDGALVTAVDHKSKSTTDLQRLENIRAHPRVSVLVDHYEEDWSRLWWVRADGRARILGEGAQREEAVSALARKYLPYRDRPPQGPVVTVAVDRWVSWSA